MERGMNSPEGGRRGGARKSVQNLSIMRNAKPQGQAWRAFVTSVRRANAQ